MIEFEMDEAGPVEIEIFDVAGRRVFIAQARGAAGGTNGYRVDDEIIGRLVSGVYFVRLRANGGTHARKFTIVR